MRRLFYTAVACVALVGCAAAPQAPAPIEPNCAVTPEDGVTDGGYGGTGNVPEDCLPQPST